MTIVRVFLPFALGYFLSYLMRVHDHVIVARSGITSYKTWGLL